MIDPNRQINQLMRREKHVFHLCFFGRLAMNSQGLSEIQKVPFLDLWICCKWLFSDVLQHPIGVAPPGYPASIGHCSLLERPEAHKASCWLGKISLAPALLGRSCEGPSKIVHLGYPKVHEIPSKCPKNYTNFINISPNAPHISQKEHQTIHAFPATCAVSARHGFPGWLGSAVNGAPHPVLKPVRWRYGSDWGSAEGIPRNL